MADYAVKRVGPSQVTVSKFNGDGPPAAVYDLEQHTDRHKDRDGTVWTERRWTCNCPRWQKKNTTTCRHVEMVLAFIAEDEPSPYWYRKD